jgi:hypothetical protein
MTDFTGLQEQMERTYGERDWPTARPVVRGGGGALPRRVPALRLGAVRVPRIGLALGHRIG